MPFLQHVAREIRALGVSFLARYAVVGSIAALVYVSLYYLLVVAAHAPSLISSCFAFSVSVLVQYTAHARFSFGAQVIDLRQGARFACATLIGLAVSSAIAFTGPRLGWPPIVTAGIVVAVIPPLNIALLASWVFVSRGAVHGESKSSSPPPQPAGGEPEFPA